jgi:hypothetical protein
MIQLQCYEYRDKRSLLPTIAKSLASQRGHNEFRQLGAGTEAPGEDKAKPDHGLPACGATEGKWTLGNECRPIRFAHLA